jgi:hypothetical protein
MLLAQAFGNGPDGSNTSRLCRLPCGKALPYRKARSLPEAMPLDLGEA